MTALPPAGPYGSCSRAGPGGNAFDFFFLAMANWQLDQKQEARRWYEKAVEWTEKNDPENEELRRFRADAAELLKIKNEQPE